MFRKTLDFILSFFFKTAIRGWGLVLALCLISSFGFLITRCSKSVKFDNAYTYNIKKSHDHEIPIDKQIEHLNKAIVYLESNNLTKGHTSIIDWADNEDLELNYHNLQRVKENLEKIKANPEAAALHLDYLKTNEKLFWNGTKEVEGISIFPHNTRYVIWGLGSILLTILAVIMLASVTAHDSRY